MLCLLALFGLEKFHTIVFGKKLKNLKDIIFYQHFSLPFKILVKQLYLTDI